MSALSGFTLIELLVVIGIIALLAAILIPMVMSSWKHANRTKLQADFATIGQALEEWKKDHQGQYPQVTQPDTGFAVLARDLVGVYGDGHLPGSTSPTPDDPNDPPGQSAPSYKPGDCVQTSPTATYVSLTENTGGGTNSPDWVPFDCRDYEDGPGTRLSSGGKKVGPYLKLTAFRVRGCALLDPHDKLILYFPAKPGGKANLSKTINGKPSFVDQGKISLYDADDNLQFFKRPGDSDQTALIRIQVMLGDANHDGIINSGEEAASTGPYLLWAPGPDGIYGPITKPSTKVPTSNDVTKCDDVTNFGK